MGTTENIRQRSAAERREWPRYDLSGGGSFALLADGRRQRCWIEDLSLGGARLRVDGGAPRDPLVRIEHPQLGSAFASRCWQDGRDLGVRFDLSQRTLDFVTQCLMARAEGRSVSHPA